MPYKIARAKLFSELEMTVNAMMSDGWEPVGGIIMGIDAYGDRVRAQAMVKRESAVIKAAQSSARKAPTDATK